MGAHLIDGEFQSDKYPSTPRGKVPLSVKDPDAQDLLWEYAQRHRMIDAEFSADLETALCKAGYLHIQSRLNKLNELQALLASTDCCYYQAWIDLMERSSSEKQRETAAKMKKLFAALGGQVGR